uniref:Protein kinase domain-containing protein n=1 Tax=Parascaris univalens TaxID=6257 RepID=A0A915BC83_PARUN
MSLETEGPWGQLNGQRTTVLKDPADEDDDPCVADEGTFARTGLLDECVLQSDVRPIAEGESSQCSEAGAEEEWIDEEEEKQDDAKVSEEHELINHHSDGSPTPAATAHRRSVLKRKRREEMEEDRRLNGDDASDQDQLDDDLEDDEQSHEVPEGGYPFATGLSSRGRKGTLIVITEDGKTWRRRNMRKKGNEQVMEYFNCISCEAVKRYVPSGKFPTLSFVHTPSTDTRILQTDPRTRRHICGNVRSTARTTAEQLLRKRKAVARLAGIRTVHAYESAASEARNIGEAENWDDTFLSNVLEEIVTRTPKRPRERLMRNVVKCGAFNLHSAISKKELLEQKGASCPNRVNYQSDYDGAIESNVQSSNSPRSDCINYPPEFPPDLAKQIRTLVANSNPSNSSGGWQLYTGDDIIVFVRRNGSGNLHHRRFSHSTFFPTTTTSTTSLVNCDGMNKFGKFANMTEANCN